MKNAIKALAVILTIVMLASFVSCGNDTPAVTTEAPGKTDAPAGSSSEGGNDKKPADSLDFFKFHTDTYEGVDYIYISGITDEGKEQTELEVPKVYNGKPVCGLEEKCFEGCSKLVKLTVHSDCIEWYANLFPGCTSLTTIVMDYKPYVDGIAAGTIQDGSFIVSTSGDGTGSISGEQSSFQGLDETKLSLIFEDEKTLDYFVGDYTWGFAADIMKVGK